MPDIACSLRSSSKNLHSGGCTT